MASMKRDEPGQVVIMQAIVARWTKASRGAPGSVARNRVPEAQALPPNPPSASWPARFRAPEIVPQPAPSDSQPLDVLLHLVAYNERNRFEEPAAQSWATLTSRLPERSAFRLPNWRTPPITLMDANGGLQVEFSWHEVPGEPPMHHLHMREQVRLAIGQWMPIRFNARHTDSDGAWYYEKHAINIGFAHGLNPAIFVTGSSDHSLSDMAILR